MRDNERNTKQQIVQRDNSFNIELQEDVHLKINKKERNQVFAKSMYKKPTTEKKDVNLYSQIREENGMEEQTLKLDPPSMKQSIGGLSEFKYNLHPEFEKKNNGEIKPMKIETFEKLPVDFDKSQKSISISYESMYNSDKDSQIYDSKIHIKPENSVNSSRVSYQSKRDKKPSHFMGQTISKKPKFNSDFIFLKKNKLKQYETPNKKENKFNLFGSTVVDGNSVFETNDKDYNLFSEANKIQPNKLNNFVFSNKKEQKHQSMIMGRNSHQKKFTKKLNSEIVLK
jgi:hypothetical protein